MALTELDPVASGATPDDGASSDDARPLRWIADIAYAYLLEAGEGRNGRELLPIVSREVSIGPKALKLALELDERIIREGKTWTAAVPEIDSRRPLERSLQLLIERAGLPLPASALGDRLASIYSREAEALADLASRLARGRKGLFFADETRIGLLDWLLDPSAGSVEDVEFENFEETAEIEVTA